MTIVDRIDPLEMPKIGSFFIILKTELIKELNHEKYKLVISHEAGDEGFEYIERIKQLAGKYGIRVRFVDKMVEDPFAKPPYKKDRFSL